MTTTTHVDEIADGIFRVSTPVPGFSFNQILVADDEPLLFHTGPRRLFEATCAGVARVLPPASLRWIGFSHVEADECGAMNAWLAAAPRATPLCSAIAKLVSADDLFDRPARGLAEGEAVALGRHEVAWLDAPHLPHGWETGYLFERRTRALLCGDLLTQGGDANPPLTQASLVEPSEGFRKGPMDYFSHAPAAVARLRALAALAPRVLACMHGSAFEGDGAAELRALAASLERS